MPMAWTPEADTKLFVKILNVTNIKLSGDVLATIAAEMGPDCTGRAIKEHIVKLKQKAAGDSPNGASVPAPAAKAPKTPKSAKTPKTTPSSRKRKRGNVAGPLDDAVSDDEENFDKFNTPSKKHGDYKSGSASYDGDAGTGGSQGDDEESPSKRVKREPSNDVEGPEWTAPEEFVRDESGDLY